MEVYRFLVIEARLDLEHSTTFAFHLGLSLCLSALILNFWRDVCQSPESVKISPEPEQSSEDPCVSVGKEPVIPVPGHFPLTPTFQSGFAIKPVATDTDLEDNTHLRQTTETISEQFKKRKVIYPTVKSAFKKTSRIPLPLDTTLQPQSLDTTYEAWNLVGITRSPPATLHNVPKSSHNALSPQNLWSPAPLWTKLLKEVRSPGLPRRSLSKKPLPPGNDYSTRLDSTDDHKRENVPKGRVCTSISSPSAESDDKSDRDAVPNAMSSPTTLSYLRSASDPSQQQEAIDNGDASQGASHRTAKRKLDAVNNKLAVYGIQVSKLGGDPTPQSIESRKQCHDVSLQLEKEVLPHLQGMELYDAKDFEFFKKYLIMETRELLDRLEDLSTARPRATDENSTSTDETETAEELAVNHNPLYGGPSEIYTSAYKVPNNLKAVHWQCRVLEKRPGVEGTPHATNVVKRVCEILRWTADFVDSLTTIDDESLERLPDDLFEKSGPLLHDIFRCGKESLKHRYPSVVDYGLPCARHIQITLESLDKRRERYRNWEEHRKVKFALPISAPS